MTTPRSALSVPDWDRLARRAAAVVGEEEPLRLVFNGGRLFVDHAGPALFVYRCAEDELDGRPEVCTAAHRLVTSQSAYLLARARREEHDGVRRLARAALDALAESGGPVLTVEVWTAPHEEEDALDPFNREPGFTLFVPDHPRARTVAEPLADALSGIEIAGQGATVEQVAVEQVAPPGLEPLVEPGERAVPLGLAVDAVFVNAREDEFYPGVLDALRTALAAPFEAATEAFTRDASRPTRPLGRRHLESAAEVVDRGLAACARQYGFLLQVTPVNGAQAWDDFCAADHERAPELLYRPLTFDPDALRRDLFGLPVEQIEDPVVARLLREKRDEMGTEIQMLLDRETWQFLAGSLRLYGTPGTELTGLAGEILDRLAEAPPEEAPAELVGAQAFAAAAQGEMEHYAEQFDGFASTVSVRDDIPGSLMVSKGHLLVGAEVTMRADRVEALLAHEVGTHVLTYFNGCAQPLRQLRHGLAGYEALQEGLAVLSEWLVDGLTQNRMRILAARVIAACARIDGASFVDSYRLLRERGLSERAAYGVTLRIHRGGGLLKDVVYLRGLHDVLGYLGQGGEIEPLFVGKMALAHREAVETLRERGVLGPMPLRPRYLDVPLAQERLAQARQGLSVLDLI